MDQNAELQAEADSLTTELAEKRHSPMQVGDPHAGGIGTVLESESQNPVTLRFCLLCGELPRESSAGK